MVRKLSEKIALTPARETLKRMVDKEPPNINIERALQEFGPEIYALINSGWMDEDIIKEFEDQDESSIVNLLFIARKKERDKKKERKKKLLTKQVKTSKNLSKVQKDKDITAQISSFDRSSSPVHALLANPVEPSALAFPNSPVRPVPLVITSEVAHPGPEQGPRPITRNSGIRRPD